MNAIVVRESQPPEMRQVEVDDQPRNLAKSVTVE